MPTKNSKQKDDNAQAIQKGGGSLSDTLRTINSGGGKKGLQTALPNAPASGGGSPLQTAVPNRPGTASSQVPAWLQTAVPTQANMQSSTARGDGGTFSDNIRTENPGTLYNPPPGVVNIDPSQMVNPYTGVPVNTSYSDTLRSIVPTKRGNTLTFSDMLRDVMAGNYKSTKDVPFNMPNNAAGGGGDGGGYSGFGSRYGGNWGGGGGGGWGGGGGGYDNTSAWMRYLLNLYSWNIK